WPSRVPIRTDTAPIAASTPSAPGPNGAAAAWHAHCSSTRYPTRASREPGQPACNQRLWANPSTSRSDSGPQGATKNGRRDRDRLCREWIGLAVLALPGAVYELAFMWLQLRGRCRTRWCARVRRGPRVAGAARPVQTDAVEVSASRGSADRPAPESVGRTWV